MKNQSSLCIVTVALLWSAVVVAAQTNKTPSIIFPPEKWDSGKHVLAPFVATNKPGNYSLPFDWAGFEKVTARSGWYTDRVAVAEQTNTLLDFDRLVVTPRGSHIISKANSWGAVYRRSLPSDVELLQMRDVSSVSNFLNSNPFLREETNGAAFSYGICFFALRPDDSIATLRVTFMKRNHESRIESILVQRAVLYSQPRGP